MKQPVLFVIVVIISFSCAMNDDSQKIIDNAIEAAGGERFENTEIQFEFRGREYGYKKSNGKYEYVRLFKDSLDLIRDVLTNDGFKREVNGTPVEVPDTMAVKYSNSINSVIYFALLPYSLNDAAVNKEYLGLKTLKGKEYHKIRITFDRQGGGKDFEDVFIYWINKESNLVDYLAYQYHTDGGGMRFREAYNERSVNAIRFVDYINYHTKTPVQLLDMDEAFLNGQLEELSRIELDNIRVNPM